MPRDKIERLKHKLDLTGFPDELEGAGWDYGTPLGNVHRLAEHWRTKYSWEVH